MSQSNSDNPPLKAMTADDIFAEMGKDDELDLNKPVEKKDDDKVEAKTEDDEEDEDKKDEAEDELALLEDDLKDIDEEKLELVTPVKRREILKEYPDLFKKFPYLEKAYYREQQFTEILPTIDDAKEAAESHRVLQAYTEDMVEKGNVSNVLKMIKETNPETFAQVADNYLDHLKAVDEGAFIHVQSNLVKNIILGMVEEAKSSGDDDYRTAALLLNKWAFGSAKFTAPQRLAKGVNPEDKSKEDSISEREKAFAQRQFDSAVGEVNSRVNNSIKNAIETNIDPKSTMTDYVRRSAIRDAQEKITSLIENDARFQKIVIKLWERAESANYSRATQDEIRKAFLSKAKSLLEPVLKSSRNAALKGMGKRVRDEDDTDEETQPERQKTQKDTERRLSSADKQKAKLDSLKGKSTLEAMNALMGDA